MIDQQAGRFGVSLTEAVLARWLVVLSGREYVLDHFQPHVRSERTTAPTAPPSAPAADGPPGPESTESTGGDSADEATPSVDGLEGDGFEVDDRFPGLGRFGRLLEVGAGHLAAAHAAYTEQGRAAAVQARALAAFAAARPAALLDRPDQEVGAAAAASRAARPAVLTEVSEWAVDEVMATFALSAPAAGGLLADSITLVQRLPATLDALEAGIISWAHARMLAEVVGPVKDEARAASRRGCWPAPPARPSPSCGRPPTARCWPPTPPPRPTGWPAPSATAGCGCTRARTAWPAWTPR